MEQSKWEGFGSYPQSVGTGNNTGSSSNINVTATYVSEPFEPQPKTFDEAVKILTDDIAALLISKQHDYGPMNILQSPFGPSKGLLVRLWDKFARVRNLTQKEGDPQNESLEDTYKDIIGYSLIFLMLQRDWFELPLEGTFGSTEEKGTDD